MKMADNRHDSVLNPAPNPNYLVFKNSNNSVFYC